MAVLSVPYNMFPFRELRNLEDIVSRHEWKDTADFRVPSSTVSVATDSLPGNSPVEMQVFLLVDMSVLNWKKNTEVVCKRVFVYSTPDWL